VVPQLRHESRLVVSADFLEEVMDRRNTEGRWDEEQRSTNEFLQQAAEWSFSSLTQQQLASVDFQCDSHMRHQQATLASLQQVCQHAPGYTHRPSPLHFPRYVMKHIIQNNDRKQTMSTNIIVQLLSENTQLHDIYSMMMAKNLANIHQCARYKARYLLADVSTTCDARVEANSALGDYIGSSCDTFTTHGQQWQIEQIYSHDRHMSFTQHLSIMNLSQ
jgi:hypothetical protein